MKVNRHNTSESYNITVGWIDEFSRDLIKKSDFIDNIKSIRYKRRFSTTDEKMSDIKARVGFDKINHKKRINTPLESVAVCSSEADNGEKCSSCDAGSACGCSDVSGFSKEDLSRMTKIINFVANMINAEPHINEHQAIAKCRENESLGFDQVPIDMPVLREYINSLIGDYDGSSDDGGYRLHEPSQSESSEDSEADYYSHSHVNI